MGFKCRRFQGDINDLPLLPDFFIAFDLAPGYALRDSLEPFGLRATLQAVHRRENSLPPYPLSCPSLDNRAYWIPHSLEEHYGKPRSVSAKVCWRIYAAWCRFIAEPFLRRLTSLDHLSTWFLLASGLIGLMTYEQEMVRKISHWKASGSRSRSF